MSEKIFRLLYVSKAVEEISYSDLKNILVTAQARNQKEQITGILIFRDGLFLQLLEGEKETVKKILGRIIQDPRHTHLKVLSESFAPKRIFKNWPMAYLDGDIEYEGQDQLQNVFSDAFLSQIEEMDGLISELVKISENPSLIVKV